MKIVNNETVNNLRDCMIVFNDTCAEVLKKIFLLN